MTVPSGQTPIVTYVYTGAGDYDFTFRVFEASDLVVTHLDSSGLRSVLTLSVDYTVALLNEGQDGGTCSLTYAVTGGTLEIRRALPQEQPTAWNNNNPFNAELLEVDLDRAIMIIQEMQAIVDGNYVYAAFRGRWQPSTDYATGDIVQGDNSNWYVAITNHTSSSSFTDDLNAGNWLLAYDVEYIEDLAAQAAQSESNAAASEVNASTSETNAAASEANASTSETNAAASEANAAADAASAAVDAQRAEDAAAEAESIVAVGERVDSMHTDSYTATAAQVDFTITNPAPETNIQVYMNSRKLRQTEDYTLNSAIAASIMTLNSGAEVGDELDIISYNPVLLPSGATGTFTSADAKTITVTNGTITSIV